MDKPTSILSIAMAVSQDTLPLVRQLAEELEGTRRSEFQDFLKRYGLRRESWFLQKIGGQHMCIAYFEGDDIMAAFERLSQSSHLFDLWLRAANEHAFCAKFDDASSVQFSEKVLDIAPAA